MFGRTKNWGWIAAFLCSTASAFATEPIVQDFDGWKITIRPGVSSIPDPAPAPRPPLESSPKGQIQLASLRQQAALPAPQDVAPVITPAGVAPTSAQEGFPIITPGESDWCCDSRLTVSPPEGTVDPRYMSQMYYDVYKSIPFIRAEYNANPSYLHDTTVEFLFGKMRPTVIQRGTTVVHDSYPAGYGVPWVYGGLGYAYPPLQLVVPGTGLRIHRLN
jgi:hypothetical protein